MQVVVDNLLTSYEQAGSKGPVILLLHGWGDTGATFKQLTEKLQANYRTLVLDLPGFGGTSAPAEVWDLDDYARFVAHFLKKVDAKPDVIIGHSIGGAVAICGLAAGDLTADSLVLLASAGIRNVYKGRKKALRLVAKAAKAATAPLPKSVQTKLKKKAYKRIGSDLFVAEHLQETFKKVITYDVQADAAKLHLPVLLIYGSEDTATPVAFGELFHGAISGSRLEVLEGVGHFVHHEQPDKVFSLVNEFIA